MKVKRDLSTPERRRWWAAVEEAAASAPRLGDMTADRLWKIRAELIAAHRRFEIGPDEFYRRYDELETARRILGVAP